jgi:hypothetical protein
MSRKAGTRRFVVSRRREKDCKKECAPSRAGWRPRSSSNDRLVVETADERNTPPVATRRVHAVDSSSNTASELAKDDGLSAGNDPP